MLLHISVNVSFVLFFSERQHSEEKRENFELEDSSQSEIQTRYFSEYQNQISQLSLYQSGNIYHKQHMATCFDQCWSFSCLFQVRYSLFLDLTQRILVVTEVSL